MSSTEIVLRREFAPIVIPPAQKLLDGLKFDLEDAADIDVCSEAMAEEAQAIVGRIATAVEKIDTERLLLTKPLREGQAWVNEGYNPTIESLNATIKDVKQKLLAWTKVVAERKRVADAAEAADRKKKADALIEAANAQVREAQKIKHQALAAQAAGDSEGAADLFSKATDMVQTSVETVSVAKQIVAQPASGGSMTSGVKGARTTWKARVVDKAKFVLICANRPELLSMLDVNESNLNALAKTNQGNVPIPGLEFYEDESIATRKK